MAEGAKPKVVVAGLGDTGLLVATRLGRDFDVVGVSTRPALVSGQELGGRLTDPARWRRTYLVPYARVRKLDRIRTIHGRVTRVDLDARTVSVERSDGAETTESYDVLVLATGATNGFWRHDRMESMADIDDGIEAIASQLRAASSVAVVGGGATGVSVADNLARTGRSEVHLFHSGDYPLPGYHPKVRAWITEVLRADGVSIHPDHRAVLPDGFTGDKLTTGPVTWSTGQEPFTADCTVWAVGHIRPHTDYLPDNVLDDDGFVLVDEFLALEGYPDVFAVGDLAATDPHHSSARNWGWQVVLTNVRFRLGRGRRRRRFRAPHYRWGSILGIQAKGMVVAQPTGRRFRIPRRTAESLLMRVFVTRYLYGGLRDEAGDKSVPSRP